MKYILLSNGEQALVDDRDYEWLMEYKWHALKGYARTTLYGGGEKHGVLMHRLINNTPNGYETDHINGNKLDNRRCNLRTVTSQQNMMNTGLWSHNTSGAKGVDYKEGQGWRSRIILNKKEIHLGYYPTMLEAVTARKEAEVKYFGEFRNRAIGNLG